MVRLYIVAAAFITLAGCQVADRSLNLSRVEDSWQESPPKVDHLSSVRVTPESEITRLVPPEPVGAEQSDLPGPRAHIVPVGYQLEPEVLPATEPVSDLTLMDLEGMALQNNPVLGQLSALVRAARGQWVQVGLPPNVVLGYSGQQLGSHGEAEQQGVFVGQQWITGKKLRLNRQVAAWKVEQAERDFESARLRVLTDVRTSYYDVLIAQRRRDVASELVRISRQGVQAAQALFRSEEVSEADPLRADVESATAGILLQNSINQHIEAWRRLTAVIAMPDLELQRLAGELNPDDLAISWQEQMQRVLSESPELAAAIANVESARWAVRRAYAEVIPNFDVQAVVQDDRSTGSTNSNLQVVLPIPLWNRNQGGISRAEAEVTAASQRVDRLSLFLQSRLAIVFQRYQSARNQVEQYSRDGGIIEKSQRTLDLIRTGYQSGEFGVVDLVTAQRTYFQTNLAYLDSLRELWVAVMEINGLLLNNSLPE